MGQWWRRALGAVGTALLAVTGSGAIVAAPAGASGIAHRAEVSGPGVSSSFWLATSAGAVYPFGVPGYGSPTGPLNRPVVTVTPTPDHHGYWLAATDGGIFSYGDAHFYGSTGALALNKPIVGMAPTADGKGYWLVATDGGIFSFGDAHFSGSTGALTLNKPIVGMASTADGLGYWLVASDGGIFAFGDAHFFGSAGSLTLGDPVERVVGTASGAGYWVIEQNGTALPFGDAVGQSPPPLGLVFTPVSNGDRAVLFAFQQLGKPYIWGGNGPVGYDCSGLALASWTHTAGISFARVADDQYHTAGVAVPLSGLQTGDLVFWGTSPTDWTSVYHTALYVGGNKIVEATGDHVQLNTLDQWGSGDVMPTGRRP